ncbi:hypothetical protein BLOT_000185 [Blomia tropicalis]|nr:hypothetical protein BLOT_000185 [Blomia tropicalis]
MHSQTLKKNNYGHIFIDSQRKTEFYFIRNEPLDNDGHFACTTAKNTHFLKDHLELFRIFEKNNDYYLHVNKYKEI